MHEVATNSVTRQHIDTCMRAQQRTEFLHNVYELPSIGHTIRYLHAAAGYPVKATWLKAIRNGNYSTWPLITVATVSKHFPESEETQHGHMRSQRQGVRSPHRDPPQPSRTANPIVCTNDVLVRIVDPTHTMYMTKQAVSRSCRATATVTSWFFIMSTQIRRGVKHSKITAKANSSLPADAPWHEWHGAASLRGIKY